jgi:flagella basal body P-ring formation protein FlgA
MLASLLAVLAWLSLAPTVAAAETVLEPGEPLTPAAVGAIVREGLAARGIEGELAVEVDRPAAPLPNRAATPMRVVLAELRHEPATGRYDARLLASLATGETSIVPVAGRVSELVEVAVLARPVGRGEIVRAEDLARRSLPLASLHPGTLREAEAIVGLQAARGLTAGRPLRAADLVAPLMVRRGEPVGMVFVQGGLEITGSAVPLEHGREGETIRVQNEASGEIRRAVVVGPRRVRVSPQGAVR